MADLCLPIKAVPREDYNYFVLSEPSGMGEGPYTFRATNNYRNLLTDSGIALKEAGEVAGSAQFPKLP